MKISFLENEKIDCLLERNRAHKIETVDQLKYRDLGLPEIEITILELRREGRTLQYIAKSLDLSIGSVWGIEQLAQGKIAYALTLREMLLKDEKKRKNFICSKCDCCSKV